MRGLLRREGPGRHATTAPRVLAATLLLALPAAVVADGTDERRVFPKRDRRVHADTIITPQMIALGDSVFHGRIGGAICFTCHGPQAKGTPGLAPNLTDDRWLHGDGSLDFIVGLVSSGVPKPKEAAAPMPPKGGGNLSTEQVRAVAAYVYSLSHR